MMKFPTSLLSQHNMTSWLLMLTLTLALAEACFIRNCPTGGKRSFLGGGGQPWASKHKCMTCGPNDLGQCVGPNICCGPSIGCYINTVEADACGKEDDNPVPCKVSGASCGTRSDGHCVANGVCCTDGKCTLDASCEDSSPRDFSTSDVSNMAEPQSHFTSSEQFVLAPDLENYIRRLLRIQQLNQKK